jgi:hypothetical protein
VLPEFPVVLRRGQEVRADIETVTLPKREQMARFRAGYARISGRIVGPGGAAAAGLRACLYERPEMLDRPLIVSQPTGPEGHFVIENAPAGSYYLGAGGVLPRPQRDPGGTGVG